MPHQTVSWRRRAIASGVRAGAVLLALSVGAPAPIAQSTEIGPSPAAIIDQIVHQISAERIDRYVRTLVGFGTRNTLSDVTNGRRGVGAARRWLKSEFERCSRESGGRLMVSDDEFIAEPGPRIPAPTPIINVIATLDGDQAASRNRTYVVSGHYDSMNSDVRDGAGDAPGADDDASGTAAASRSGVAIPLFLMSSSNSEGEVGATGMAAHFQKTARASESVRCI